MRSNIVRTIVLHADVHLLGENVLAFYHGNKSMWLVTEDTRIEVRDLRQATKDWFAADNLATADYDITEIFNRPARVTVLVVENLVTRITLEDTKLPTNGIFYMQVDEFITQKSLEASKWFYYSAVEDLGEQRAYGFAFVEYSETGWASLFAKLRELLPW